MVLTGEPSGDFHAGHLVEEIRQARPDIYVSGIGGPCLEDQDVELFYRIENLSAMGLTEVLMQFRQIKQAFEHFKAKMASQPPDLIILVDYPGFNLRAAQFARDHYPVKILYYILPKVWAWKRSRLKKIKRLVDHAALIFPFEERLYKRFGISSTYVGNPLMDVYPENGLSPSVRSGTVTAKGRGNFTIGLLPGSRNAEINNLLEIMIQAAERVHQKKSRVEFLVSRAGSIRKESIEKYLQKSGNPHLFNIHDAKVSDLFLKSDLVIAASGTVTLEAALCCVPTIIVYKMSPISYGIARLVVRVKYAGLANLIAGAQVMPELLQKEANPFKISQKALHMLDYLDLYQDRLLMVRKLLGNKGAAKRTAKIALHLLDESKQLWQGSS